MRYIIFIIMLMAANVIASPLTTGEFNTIADAIYRVEGGANTRWPYGIKSVVTQYPRQVCINTVSNNFERWSFNKDVDFFEYLGDHYCPPIDDPQGNKNWKHNMDAILGKRFRNLKKFKKTIDRTQKIK